MKVAEPKEQIRGYNSWRGMRDRCSSPSHISYPWYGGKGIKVCDRWNESFENFIADLGPPPEGKQWIERLDNDQGYEPGNCVWATPAQQLRNYSRNRWLTAFGKTMVVQDWAREIGLSRSTIDNRLRKGATAEEALAPL